MRGHSSLDGRRTVGLTSRGWGVLIVAVLCLIFSYATGIDGLLFTALFLGAAVGSGLLSAHHRRPRLAAHRAFENRMITARQPVEVALEVANLEARSVGEARWQDFCDYGDGMLSEATEIGSLPAIAGRGSHRPASARLRYTLRAPRRGKFILGPLRIRVADPFGLAWGLTVAGEGQAATALPEVVELADAGIVFTDADGATRRVNHRSVGGDHDLTTRDYRAGDPLRRVHWRASAHHGELMVRQEEQRSNSEAHILLDTRAAGYPDYRVARPDHAPDSESFEWAVSCVASLGVHLRDAGFVLSVIETAPAQLDSSPGLAELLEGLATITPRRGMLPPAVSLLPGTGRGESSGGAIFAVVAEPDAATVQAMLNDRGAFSLAIAFVLRDSDWAADITVGEAAAEEAAESALETALRGAGWLVVGVDLGITVAEAWILAGEAAEHHAAS